MSATPHQCARIVIEAVPHLMRVIRTQVHRQSSPELTMPQFRALAFLGRNDDAMLSDVAAFLGLTPPAASKLVDGLVAARLVAREAGLEDRRRVALTLTPGGRRKYDGVVQEAETYLASRIGQLDAGARSEVLRALQALHTIFEDPPETRRANSNKSLKTSVKGRS